MIDLLTLRDILRVAAWAAFGTLPLVLAARSGYESGKDNEADHGLQWFMLATAFQLGILIAAYLAGEK